MCQQLLAQLPGVKSLVFLQPKKTLKAFTLLAQGMKDASE
jgi:hypothetical protein